MWQENIMYQLEGRTVLITGGAGFIGSTTADQLLLAGAAEVRILDDFSRGYRRNLDHASSIGNLVIIHGDIRDPQTVDSAVQGVDYVFHEAALRITRCAEDPRAGIEVLVNGTLNILESSVRHKVKKVVAASSASVYGNPVNLPMNETHPFNNRTLYGAAKIANEQMFRAYYEMHGLSYVALRYFNVYGPRMDLDGVYTEVMVRWMDAIRTGQAPKIFGDGTQSMDFVYVEDVARANRAALESQQTDDVFNVGTGQQTTLEELSRLLLRIYGSGLTPEYLPARAVNNVQARRADVSKAERLMGFKARVDLETGLRAFVQWREGAKSESALLIGGAR
jgi:UDP-glucose 4-epimerase